MDHSNHRVGLGQMYGMPSPRNQRRHSVRRRLGQAQGVGAESIVIRSGQSEQRDIDVPDALPQRFLCPRSGQAKARRQSRRRVTPTFCCICRIGQSGEHRAGDPRIDEGVHVTRCLECIGRRLVGLTPLRPLARIFDPTRGTDHHGLAQSQSHAGAQRIPQQLAWIRADVIFDRLGHRGRGLDKIGAHGIGAGMTGQVDPDQRATLGECVAERTPQAGGLREPVQQHQRRALATDLDMEWHVR